jgi:parallel beta-helix repeat protein
MRKFNQFSHVATLLLAAAGCGSPNSSGGAGQELLDESTEAVTSCVTPKDNLLLKCPTTAACTVTVCPKSYVLDDVAEDGLMKIGSSNITVVMTNVTLKGSGRGYAIYSKNFSNVKITSDAAHRGAISGFRAAVIIDGMGSHEVSNCNLSHNHRRPINTGYDFLDVWADNPPTTVYNNMVSEDQVGNGVVLLNVTSGTVRNNLATDQQNGIGLFSTSNVTVVGNDCSNNQGWGIHLHQSSFNNITGNTANNVNLAASTECHNLQDDACDTAAVLVIMASNDNIIQSNTLRGGGDGIFSAALHGLTHYGADRNQYISNDVSLAKHHGIEATFATSLTLTSNTINDVGRAGVWLGYSTYSTIGYNTILRAGWSGIQNQNGQNIDVLYNTISSAVGDGINLTEEQIAGLPQQSTTYRIRHNTISNNAGHGISATDTHAITATNNVISNNAAGNIRLSKINETTIKSPLTLNDNNMLGSLAACSNVSVPACGGCRAYDNNQPGCDAAGCAYYFCSNECHPAGLSLCEGGCTDSCQPPDNCRLFDGNASGCNAAPGCSYHACSAECYPTGTSDCDAGCASQCGCDWTNANLTRNYWGTTNTSQIAATLCDAPMNFQPIRTSTAPAP